MAVPVILLVATLVGAAGAPAAPAQEAEVWATRSAEMDVDLTRGDGSAHVTLRYRLAARDPQAPLPVDEAFDVGLLDFGDLATEEVTLDGLGRLVLWPTVGSRRSARVEPPLPGTGAEGSPETLELVFRYVVGDAVVPGDDGIDLRARIPVLTGPAVAAEDGEPAFRATLQIPEGWSVTEGFPSSMDATGEGRLTASLQVVPSMVGFRGRADGTWRPGVPLVVDVLTVLGLLVFAGFGWRHLRRVAA